MNSQASGSGIDIDGFTVTRELGSGAMGRVFLAEQHSPHRQVAIKVLNRAGSEMAGRFRREADLLARLEHPNIARVYETGEADIFGAPTQWIAMEFVQGSNLRDYCAASLDDAAADRVDAALALIRQVGIGLQAAHSKGVIHRDLKPENVHVTPDGVAKILDFGLAQMIGDDAMTAMTRDGEILGTVPYMSWEQLTGNYQQLDGRSDLYSLGAIAYELVGRQPPYPGLSQVTLVGAVDRLSRETPKRLCKLDANIPADADTLVMKALAREPDQRYATVGDFVADIERFLRREAIKARPPSAAYLVSMFVRRHKALSAVISLSLVALVIAAGVAVRYSVEAQVALTQSQQRLEEREAVAEFLTDMIEQADPENLLGGEVSIRQAVTLAAKKLETEQPQMGSQSVARLHLVLAPLQDSIGAIDRTKFHLESAATALSEMQSPDTALQDDLAVARAAHLFNIEAFDQVVSFVNNELSERSIKAGHKLRSYRALSMAALQEFEPAEREFVDLLSRSDDLDPDIVVQDYFGLLMTYRLSGQAEKFKATAVRAIGYADTYLGFHDRATENLVGEYALGLMQIIDPAAERVARDFLARTEARYGATNPNTVAARNTVVNVMILKGQFADALPLAQANYEAAQSMLPPSHSKTIFARSSLAWMLEENGQAAAAENHYRDLVEIAEAEHGPRAVMSMEMRNGLGMNLVAQGRPSEAVPQFESIRATSVDELGYDHPQTGIFVGNLGGALIKAGQRDVGRQRLQEARAILAASFDESHPRVAKLDRQLEALATKEQRQ